MTCWDFCGFDQRFGSAACFSISASRGRRLPASKVLPKFADLVLQNCVFLIELDVHDLGSAFLEMGRRVSNAATEIIAHSQANQSPWAV
jgi:hypothetical protein